MELECFTILDPSTLELFLTAKFKNIKPELRRPSLQNFYDIERLPLLRSANNQEVFLEYSQPTNHETKIRSLIEQNISLYLKESLFTENGFLWMNYASSDVFRNVGLFFKYIADYRLIQKSVYLRTGQITDENNLESFKNNLIDNALADLEEIETILKIEKHDTKVSSMIASMLVPLSLEIESKIGKYINGSVTLNNFVEEIKRKYLSEFSIFKKNETSLNYQLMKHPVIYFQNHKFQFGLVCFTLFAFYKTRKTKIHIS